MMPTKLTREKDKGTVISCGHTAAEGVLAREAKSGALLLHRQSQVTSKVEVRGKKLSTHVTSVAMLLMHDMRLTTMDHPNSEPWTVDGREMIGPTP